MLQISTEQTAMNILGSRSSIVKQKVKSVSVKRKPSKFPNPKDYLNNDWEWTNPALHRSYLGAGTVGI